MERLRELKILETFLLELRQEMARPNDIQATFAVIERHRSHLPELHAFVRGMIYGL
jgi:hypothetical protein